MTKFNTRWMLLNLTATVLLGAFIYHPTKLTGSYRIPGTLIEAHFGEQVDYSKFVINASQLKPGKKS